MVVRTLAFCILLLSSATSSAGAGSLPPAIDALQAALNERDIELLEPHLEPGFAWGQYAGPMGREILRQVVAGYPRKIEKVEIVEVRKHEGSETAEVLFHLDGGETESHELELSESGRLLRAEVVQIQMAGHSGPEHEESSAGIPERMTVPFELADRLIVVDAEVAGVRGRFIVDSGCSAAMVLDRSRFPELAARSKRIDDTPHGANGAIGDVARVEAPSFLWQGLELESVQADLWDLSHLAKATGVEELLGLIGRDLLEPFVLEFDYPSRTLVLTALDADGKPVMPLPPSGRTIVMDTVFHLPVVKVEVGGRTLRLGIDSGAEEGMLQTRWSDPLRGHYVEVGRSEMIGAEGRSQEGIEVQVEGLRVEHIAWDGMPFRFNDLQFPHEVEIDGLLGYDFLSRFRIAINLRAGELTVWAGDSETVAAR